MTLTGIKKHVQILEDAGLVTTEKVGRVRTCSLGPRRLEDETGVDRDSTSRCSRPGSTGSTNSSAHS